MKDWLKIDERLVGKDWLEIEEKIDERLGED